MILVTGGAGFIGSVIVHMLNERGIDDIVIVDRLKDSEKWLNLRSARFLQYIHADDLLSAEGMELVEQCRCIFHMGACSSTTERDMDFLMENNVGYSQSLFDVATSARIPFIYASSAATYGDGERGFGDEHEGVSKLRPINRYGYSKQLFDQWVLRQEDAPPFWVGVKFFNVFGPGEQHKGDMRSLVDKAYGQIGESGRVRLFKSHRPDYKDGEQLRDFIYVKDAVRALLAFYDEAMKRQSTGAWKHNGIYNLGTGKARSFMDLMLATFKAMGREPAVDMIDMPESLRRQYQYFTEADMKKFHRVFPGFKFTSLESSVADYVGEHLMKHEGLFR